MLLDEATASNVSSWTSAFETDINDQAAALRDFDLAPYSPRLVSLMHCSYERIILTGVGASHYAALPSWRRLAMAGRPAWWVDTGQLLDSPQLITDDSLLIATSRCGASKEVVELLDLLDHTNIDCSMIGVTNDVDSPLGIDADCTVLLRSGPEVTASTKSYLNALAAHDLMASLLLNRDTDEIGSTAAIIDQIVLPAQMAQAAAAFTGRSDRRLAFVGYQDHAATALYAGLITKQTAKIPAESYVGGELAHGLLELAGPDLTAVIFVGSDGAANAAPVRLIRNLVDTGSTVIVVGGAAAPDVINVQVPPKHVTAQLSHGAVLAQCLAVSLARAQSIAPGAFESDSFSTAL